MAMLLLSLTFREEFAKDVHFPLIFFVICIELLAISIRNDFSLRGISIIDTNVNREIKVSLYADDTTLLLPGNETALRKALQIIDKFRVCSGLKLNFSKCKLLRIGALKNSNLMFCSDYDLQWTNQPVPALGMVFSNNMKEIICLYYEPQMKRIQNLLNIWQQRNLSLIGKTTIIKTLAPPKLVFLFTSLPNPKEAFFLQLKKVIVNSLWNNKPPKIKYTILINEHENGGCKLLDPKSFCQSLKISWVKRILGKDTSFFWKVLSEKNLRSVGGNLIWSCNFDNKDSLLSNIKNNFLVDVLVAWSDFRFQYYEGRSQSLNRNEIIWNNSYIKINGSSFFYEKWHQQGICKMSHLMDAHDSFLSFQAFQLKYSQLKCNFLEYFSVITAIKNSKDFLNSPLKTAISFILKQKKICKSVYSYILKRSAEFPLKSTNKWQNIFPSKTFQ